MLGLTESEGNGWENRAQMKEGMLLKHAMLISG